MIITKTIIFTANGCEVCQKPTKRPRFNRWFFGPKCQKVYFCKKHMFVEEIVNLSSKHIKRTENIEKFMYEFINFLNNDGK